MQGSSERILTLNGGISSLKLALFTLEPRPTRILSGKFDRNGLAQATLAMRRGDETPETCES